MLLCFTRHVRHEASSSVADSSVTCIDSSVKTDAWLPTVHMRMDLHLDPVHCACPLSVSEITQRRGLASGASTSTFLRIARVFQRIIAVPNVRPY